MRLIDNVGYIKKKSSRFLISSTVAVALFLIIGGLIQNFTAFSEPIVTDNPDGTKTANWTLEDPSYYNLYNLTMENSAVNLTLNSFWWNQTTQSDFETGTMLNVNTSAFPGNLTLNSTSPGGAKNLIKNGKFETNENWSFDSSDNITSEWFASGEYGILRHYSATNPPITGKQNVSSGSSDGSNGGSAATDVVDALQHSDDGKYWQVYKDKYIIITGINVTGRTGKIISVVLWGRHRIESGQYDGWDGSSGNSSLQYKNESGTFQNTTIIPETNTTWKDEWEDITGAYAEWTWQDIQNLNVRFVNPDDQNPDAYVEWDRIWLEVTIERFDQTAYINQTFEVLNTTGFNETLYEDFAQNMENTSVSFTLEPDSVVLDYSGPFSYGQIISYANETDCAASDIYKGSPFDDGNYGGAPYMFVGGSLDWTRSLLKLNVSDIPSGAIILDANLSLFVESVNDDNVPVEVHRVTMDWDEGTTSNPATDGVTWHLADASPETKWTDGGEFDPIVYNTSIVNLLEANVFHSFNITTLVQEWVDGTPNYGLILKDAFDGIARSVKFTSDDGAASQIPELVVNWALPNYYTYGNFTSQIFDAEKVVDNWGNISWNGETPMGTTIAIQTRSGNTLSPDASWSSWSINYTASGDGIASPPTQYIQYRAHLETTDINITPTLYDVTIVFSRTNLTFDRFVENCVNVTEAEMSVAINDTVVWNLGAAQSPWTTEPVDISEWIVSKGVYNISLRFHLIIETEDEVNCSVGYDNVTIGGLANESRGEYISIGFNAGSKAIWDQISWNPYLPQNTTIIVQTRTSPDNSSWGSWSTAYSNPNGNLISSSDNQYIQYRAILITTNETRNPKLSDVNISYMKYCWNGTLEMKSDFIPANLTSWGTFIWEEQTNGQTNITYWYSIDSGGNWTKVPDNGDQSSVDTLTGTIRFRANFTTNDTSITPTLYGFSLRYFTNSLPELMNGGYINETGAFGEGWFNFSVEYLDPDDDYPAPIKLTIIGDGNYNVTMTDLDETDFDVTDGKWFYYNITLPKGSYQYRFIAYDGNSWNATSYVSFLVNNNPPALLYSDVEPNTGNGGTTFNFTAAYFDKDDDAPQWMNITILGPISLNLSMLGLDPADTTYSDGKEYYYLQALPKGTYTYYFNASDGEVWSSIGPFTLNVANNPPELTIPQITPSSGWINTSFNFTVTYSDVDDEPPDNITVNLTGPSNSGSYIMMEVDPSDIIYSDGKEYYYQITGLSKGSYSCHFAANDSEGEWTETAEVLLPQVLNTVPQILTNNVLFIDEDVFYSVQYLYLDADADVYVWILNTNASWLTLDSNTGYLNGTPDNGDVGWYWVNVTLSDNDGGINWTYFILTVNNTPPLITTTSPNEWAVENYLYSFDFEGEDEGEGNAYWDRETNASWLDINSSTGVLYGTPGTNEIGWYWVNVTLYDGNGGSDSHNFTITVNDTSAPIADAGADGFTQVGIIYPFDGLGSTDNSGYISNYTWYFGDGTVGYGASPTHIYTSKGIFSVTLIVRDESGNEGFDTINITVLNTDPQILTSGVMFVDEDTLYSVQYQYLDVDGDVCLWALDTNASWLSIDPNTGYLNGTPDNGEVGWYWVNVTISDNDGGINWSYFVLTVNNTPPLITTTSPNEWILEGFEYSFDFNGEDEGEGNAYWDIETNASWLEINASSGVVSGTPGTIDVGWYWVNVTLYDGNGGQSSLNFTIIVNDTSDPITDAGEDGFTFEDLVYLFNGSGSVDNSGMITNYTWYFGDGSVGYGVTPTHTYTNQGVYFVALFVRDASGNEGYDTINITVLNFEPVADAGPDVLGNEGEPVSFDASESYDTPSDNTTLIYLWDFDYDGQYDDGFGIVTSYIWYDEGVYTIGLKVIDDNGNYSIDELNVTVNNVPPTVDLDGPYSGLEGEKIFFLATADDAGYDTFSYRWDWDDDGQNDTGWGDKSYTNHTWTQFGTYTIRVEVMDSDGGYANDTASVVVIRPEQPPVISGVGGRYVHFDYPYLLDLTRYVSDPDTPTDDLIVTTSDPTHIQVNGIILTLTYPYSMVGQTRVVTITVSDGKNTDNDTLTVTITDNFPPQVSGEIPDVEFDEGETLEDEYDLDNYFTDGDGDPLSYNFIGNVHVRPAVDSTGFISFSADPNWFGIEDITVRAYDTYGAFAEQDIRVTVKPVNFPPTIGGIHDVFVRLDSPWELFVLNPVYVWDDDSILDLSLSTNSSFVTPSTTKEGVLVFHYIDPFMTTEIVQISVTDGEFIASTDVTVYIQINNWPPYIKDYGYPSDVRFDEDTELPNHFNLNDHFADNATDVLTFTFEVPSVNVFVSIDSQGLVSFSASENWFGVTTATFKAQDTSGAWVSFTINVTVNPVNDPPEIVQKITYLRIDEGETWIIDLEDYFYDLESGNNLTYSCNKPDIIIDPVTHEARWIRDGKTSLEGMVFTASDGEDDVSMDPVNLTVVGTFNWLWILLAGVFGAFGVFAYRELRYRYRIEDVLLINNAGILLTHLSRESSKVAVDAELVSAMLTAVQEFVKDSFSRGELDSEIIKDKKKSLEKLEFGGFHLVMEPGEYTFLCAVISGYVNTRLRRKMRTVLDEFEGEYRDVLHDWDGVMERFEGVDVIIGKLIKKGVKAERTPFGEMEDFETDEAQEISFGETLVSQPVEGEEKDTWEELPPSSDDGTEPDQPPSSPPSD